MEFEAQKDRSFHVNALFLSFSSYDEATERKDFTFTEVCMNNFVAQSFLIMWFSYLERQPSARLLEVTYKTALRCETLMKMFQTVSNQSNGTMQKCRRLLI